MRGIPTTLWTCDRCGATTTTLPSGSALPDTWRFASIAYPTRQGRTREVDVHLCGPCVKDVRKILRGAAS